MKMNNLDTYRFYMQGAISFSVVVFSMTMLCFHPGGKRSNEALFASLLSGVLGYWLPSPGAKREANIAVDSEQTNILAGDAKVSNAN